MAKWTFCCIDNSGKCQSLIVKANDKPTAIKLAFEKAKEKARGDITSWNCCIKQVY